MRRKVGFIPRRIWNALVAEVYANRVTQFVGGQVRRTEAGTVLEVGAGRRGGEGRTAPPWDIQTSGTDTLAVGGGYVRGTTGAGETLTSVETVVAAADVTVTGAGSIWLVISLTGYQLNRYHSLELDTGQKQVTSVPTISFLAAASAPTPSTFAEGSSEIEDATTLYVRIADVSLNNGVAAVDAVYLRDHYQLPYISYGVDS